MKLHRAIGIVKVMSVVISWVDFLLMLNSTIRWRSVLDICLIR